MYSEYKKLDGPEERPGAVREIEHAIRFRPAQIMLDIRSSLRLNDETNQAQNQEPGRNEILATSGMLRFVFWASTADH